MRNRRGRIFLARASESSSPSQPFILARTGQMEWAVRTGWTSSRSRPLNCELTAMERMVRRAPARASSWAVGLRSHGSRRVGSSDHFRTSRSWLSAEDRTVAVRRRSCVRCMAGFLWAQLSATVLFPLRAVRCCVCPGTRMSASVFAGCVRCAAVCIAWLGFPWDPRVSGKFCSVRALHGLGPACKC